MEINGRAPRLEELRALALNSYGHFTAMQVRGGRVRGLELHLNRLDAANRELFGEPVDRDAIRSYVRQAVDGDASVRVILAPDVLVTVRPPAPEPAQPVALKSVRWLRPAPHLKHTGGFGQTYYFNEVAKEGFDDPLFVAADGAISEAGIANVAFWDGSTLVWPDGPQLAGITMQLLEPLLDGRRGPVRLEHLDSYRAALYTNSHGIAVVSRGDGTHFAGDDAVVERARAAYHGVAWDEI
jgi:branched-subunit amino acid aminotransferase/4-amino-4-deoxychorismate lyase